MMILLSSATEAAADAAVKAQEGSVDHWIEYYERERAQGSGKSLVQPTVPAKKNAEENAAAEKARPQKNEPE